MATFIHSHIVHDCFHTTMAESGSCDRNSMAYKTYLALFRTSLLTS